MRGRLRRTSGGSDRRTDGWPAVGLSTTTGRSPNPCDRTAGEPPDRLRLGGFLSNRRHRRGRHPRAAGRHPDHDPSREPRFDLARFVCHDDLLSIIEQAMHDGHHSVDETGRCGAPLAIATSRPGRGPIFDQLEPTTGGAPAESHPEVGSRRPSSTQECGAFGVNIRSPPGIWTGQVRPRRAGHRNGPSRSTCTRPTRDDRAGDRRRIRWRDRRSGRPSAGRSHGYRSTASAIASSATLVAELQSDRPTCARCDER